MTEPSAWKRTWSAIWTEVRTPAQATSTPGLASILLVACLSLLLWLPRLRGPLDLRYDAGVYYILGVSLAEGKGYRLLNEPGEIHAIQYPPLLPLLVAAHVKALGTADPARVGHALRITFCVFSVLYAGAVYSLARLFLSDRLALAAAGFTTCCCFTYFLSDLLFAELPFALVTTLFVLTRRLSGWARSSSSAILGVSAVLLRTLGVALILAWVAEALLRRRFKAAALRAMAMVVPLLGWQAYVFAIHSGPEYRHPAYTYQRAPYLYYNVSYAENVAYRDPFRPEMGGIPALEVVTRALKQAARLPLLVGESVSAPRRFWEWAIWRMGHRTGYADPWPFELAAVGFLGLITLAGLLLLACQGERLSPLYVAFTFALILMTPWPAQFTRYASPLTPFLAVGFVLALDTGRRLAARLPSRLGRAADGALAGLALSVVAIQAIAIAQTLFLYHQPVPWADAQGRPMGGRLFYYDRAWRAFDRALESLGREAQAGDVVATSAPHYVYLRTGLKSVMPPMEGDVETAQRLLDSVPVTYLIVDGLDFADITRRYGLPVVANRPGVWELRYSGDGPLKVYRRRR